VELEHHENIDAAQWDAAVRGSGDSLLIRLGYRLDERLSAYGQINVTDATGERVITLRSSHAGTPLDLPAGEGTIECRVEDLRLLPGEYRLTAEIGVERGAADWLDCVPEALRIHVHLGHYLQAADLARGQRWFAQRSRWQAQSGAAKD
jgi:hypothetical protein